MPIRRKRSGLSVINKLGISYFFISLGIALTSTVWAIYLESFVHNASSVGFLSSLFTFLGIASYILFIPLVEKKNKTRCPRQPSHAGARHGYNV